jgi:hypothetical protein
MYRAKIRSLAAVALLATVTAFANGCYYYGWGDDRSYYAGRDWRYYHYYDRRYDPRYDRYYDSRYAWRYRDRYYDDRQAWVWRQNRDRYSD